MEGHDEAECSRKMSRRWFFGACVGAAAATVIAPPVNSKIVELLAAHNSDLFHGSRIAVSRYLYRIPLQLYRGGNFKVYELGADNDGLSYEKET